MISLPNGLGWNPDPMLKRITKGALWYPVLMLTRFIKQVD